MLGEAVLARAAADCIAWWHHAPPLHGNRQMQVDLSDGHAVERAWQEARPAVVLHLAGISSTEACERDPAGAWQLNVGATRLLAELAARAGVRMILVSTDQVFAGDAGPYHENAPAHPRSQYGLTKRLAEQALLAANIHNLVVRLPLLLGRHRGQLRQLDWMTARHSAGLPVELYGDELRTPLDSSTAAQALLEVCSRDDLVGVLHIAGRTAIDRYQLGCALLRSMGHDPSWALRKTLAGAAHRAADTRLDTTRAAKLLTTPLPDFDAVLRRALA